MAAVKKRRKKGLTPDLFRDSPEWAKQAFAIRLMNCLVPPAISRRLLKMRWPLAAIFPPAWTPGDELPAGIISDTAKTFPAGWKPGDPLPPGVIVAPGAFFPPGWTPGETLPPGVTIDTSVFFPPGWTPDNPLPPGAIDPAETPLPPPGWKPGDPIPPNTFDPGLPVPGIGLPGIVPPMYVPPMGAGPIKTGGTSPGGKKWYNCTDDTYWEQVYSFFTWTGTAWRMYDGNGDGEIRVNSSATWEEGFRPTHMRLTYTGPATKYTLYDTSSNKILIGTTLASGESVALDFSNDIDMRTLAVTDPWPNGDIYITAIEFFA